MLLWRKLWRAMLVLAVLSPISAGQSEQEKVEFQKVLKNDPDSLAALSSLGEIYLHEGRLDEAEATFRRAANVKGSGPQIRMQWAVVLARLHRYKEAQSALAGLSPPVEREERVTFYRLKASIASGLGSSAGAASEMEKALALQPQEAALILATAVAQLRAQNWQRAASLSDPLFSRTHNRQAGLVLLEAQLGAHQDFHKTLEQLHARQLSPQEELTFRQRLAELLISHDEFSPSIEELARAAELDPTRADLTYNLALAQFKAGRLQDALASAEKSRASADSADVEDLLGDIEEARGDNLAAVRSYQAAIALAPAEEKYRLSLAVEFIRHQNFDGARVVLKQAEDLWPSSWRTQLALGMVEHFAGNDENAIQILLRAAQLAPEPQTAMRYLGEIQLGQASIPAAGAVSQVCAYSERYPNEGKLQYYCGAMLFRRDYVSGDKARADEILHRLNTASSRLVDDAAPHCQLGNVYRWMERWQDAQKEFETCVRLDPNSTDGHYRLAQIFQHFGELGRAKQELNLYQAASKRVADENARRDETMKTFLLTIRDESSAHK